MMRAPALNSRFERRRSMRRGSVVIIVMWAIAVAAIITSSVQLFSYRQATLGREALQRVQARWAARAGIEDTLAVMTEYTEKPEPDDAKALTREMYYVSSGQTLNASYEITHHVDGVEVGGPIDEHSKLNVNNVNDRGLLLALDDMTLDVLDALGDWLDVDDEVSALGVERDYYLALETPYEPRNGALRSLGEVELVAGVWPEYFRGEDWNLNGRRDPNEDDGDRSLPEDEPDRWLEGGWSSHLTTYSVAGGATNSGLPRIYLRDATAEEIEERLGLEPAQAEALIQFGQDSQANLSDLVFTPLGGSTNATPTPTPTGDQGGGLSTGDQAGAGDNDRGGAGGAQNAGVPALTDDQLRAVLAECAVQDPLDRTPGKMNLNTIHAEFFRDMMEFMGVEEAVADEIIYLRDSQPEGMTSLVDLKDIPNITQNELRAISSRFDVVSNVFTISSRGRAAASGLEVEIIVVVDRSTVPVTILEYREQ